MIEPIDPTRTKELRGPEALALIQPLLAALEKSKLVSVNLDPFMAASLARAAFPRINAKREMLEGFAPFDISHLDLLDTYALALLQADANCRAIALREKVEPRVLAEAKELRNRLFVDVNVLVKRGFVSSATLENIRKPHGYFNLGFELVGIAAVLRNHWERFAPVSGIQSEEVARAQYLGEELLLASRLRGKLTPEGRAAVDQRQRVFTLFVRAYTEIRRALVYLRYYEGDVDTIAPSLYTKWKARSKKPEVTQEAGDTSKTCGSVPNDPLVANEEPTDSLGAPAATTASNESLASPAGTITDPFIH